MAKLSEIYKVGMSADDIPKVSYNNNGGGDSAPASYSPGKKLSQYYTVGMSAPEAKPVTIPKLTQTAQPTQTEPTKLSFRLTNPLNIGSSFSTLTATGGNTLLRKEMENAEFKRKSEEARQKELEAFDRADTSNVVYSSPTAKLTQNKLDMWLDPSYEMSSDEKKEAKKYLSDITKEIGQLERKRFVNPISSEETQRLSELNNTASILSSKTSGLKQFITGLSESMPLASAERKAQRKVYNALSKDNETLNKTLNNYLDTQEKSIDIAKDSGAYTAGHALGKIGQYYALNASGILEPLNNAISGWFSPRLSTALASGASKLGMSETAINSALALGEKLGASLGNVLSDEVADILLDTLPEMAENIHDGMSADEVKKAVLKNLGINMAYNVAGEALPSVVKSIKGKLGCSQEAAEQIAKNADEISDAVAKETTGEAPKAKAQKTKAVPEVTPVAKETVSPTFADDVAKIRKALGDDVNKARDWSNQYAINFKDSLETLKKAPSIQNYNNAVKALDAYEVNLPEGVSVNTSLRESLDNLKAQFNNATSVDLTAQTVKQTNTPIEELKAVQKPVANELPQATKEVVQEELPTLKSVSSKKILSDNAFASNINSLKHSFDGKVKYIKDTENEYAKAFKEALDNFSSKPTKASYNKAINALDNYVKNSGTAWKKNYNGEWYEKTFDDKSIRSTLEEIGTKYNLNNNGLPKLSEANQKNLIMAEDIGLRKGADDLMEDVAKNASDTTAVADDVVKASGYAEPENATKFTAEYNERGMSKHVVGEETPMRVKDVSGEVKKMFKDEPDAYQVLKNKDTKALADEIYKSADKPIQIGDRIYSGNAETKFRSLLAEKNPASLPLGHQLAKDYSKTGNHEMAALIYRDMGKALTEAGQFSQASIINMMKNDPLTALQYAQRQLKDLNEEGAKRFGKKWKDFALTDDEIKAFDSIAPGNEEAIKALYDQIGARLAKDYPTTFMEKLLEARKVAMLFNVRTNVRNFGANVPTLGLRWMSDRVEALGQNIAHLIDPNFKVTQAVTGSGLNGRKLAKEVFESSRVQDLLNADVGKYELPSIKNNLMKDRQMFKGTAAAKWFDKFSGDAINKLAKFLDEKNIIKNDVNVKGGIQALNSKLYGKDNVQSVLETIRNTTYKALDLGDRPFVKENFIERLGSYINAQGIKSIDDVPEEAIQTAWEEAMKATYKDDSWAVHMLRGIKKSIEKVPGVGKPVSQAVIPFLQAPGNIAARMVDYSPIRGTKGIADIIMGAKSKNEEVVRRGIEEVAKGLTGTGMILFGMRLKESGLITGDYSEDKDEKNFQKQNGFKPWALHIGDKYFTYDWAQPFAQNLMVGTLIQEAIENSDKEDASVLRAIGYEGPKAAVNSWFNASPLQGLADLMKGSGYSSKPDIAQNLIDVGVGDFTGALIPSLVNAVAKTEDTTQRNAYDPSSLLNTFVNQQKSKIPRLSETLPAKYDTWGNRINYADSTGEAFAQRFLVPGDYGTEKNDRINDEINRLFKSTNDNAVFPQTAPNKVGDTTLNNTQVSDYQRDMGKRSRTLVETLVKTDLYKNLDDASRVELLKNLYGASKLITERDMFKKPVSDNSSYKKLIEAYDNGGTKGMIDYLADTQQIKQFKKEAGALRPDGSEKSLDKQELAVYLNSQGYSLDEINEWIEKGNFGKPYTQSEFNNVISKSRSWK